MRRLVMVVAIVALLVSTAAVSWGQGGGGGNRGGGMQGMQRSASAMSALTPPLMIMGTRMQDALKLTDDQKAKLKTAMDEYTKATEAMQPKIDDARKALRSALANPSSTDADIQKSIAAAQEADKPVEALQVKLWKAVTLTLTADQLKTLDQPRAMGGGMRRGGGGATPPPPGPTTGN